MVVPAKRPVTGMVWQTRENSFGDMFTYTPYWPLGQRRT
jgi:hypothetical protein